MKLILVVSCTLPYILTTICVLTENKVEKEGASLRLKKVRDRHRYVADAKKVMEAAPYHQVYARMHENNIKFESWPELDSVDELTRVIYCQKYIVCIGNKDKAIGEDSVLDTRPLVYYAGWTDAPRKSLLYHKINRVRILRCQVAHKRVYRFIRGSEQYHAFFVQATGAAGTIFTIVGACRTDVFNAINSEPTNVLNKSTNMKQKKKKFHADLKIIRNAGPYQKIHAKMYGDDLKAYVTWPELEDKGKNDLYTHCYKYIKCMKLEDSIIIINSASLHLEMLKYYIADEMEPPKKKRFNYRHYHTNRWVRTLKCKTGWRARRFIQANNGFSAFLIEPTNTKYDLFAIVNACKSSFLSKIGDVKSEEDVIALFSAYRNDNTLQSQTKEENYEEELYSEHNNKDDFQKQEHSDKKAMEKKSDKNIN